MDDGEKYNQDQQDMSLSRTGRKRAPREQGACGEV
eukprot:CAMPEP_0196663918 /NCGR_PEP_ID=MMETSP1086-20130531/54818_1 /TAXON_ID=77921 /ORGANISM="Cyanoptyche  gloeocystis , Strain SAG4.97" /LENGTH=34 /DNA_ID= /DNA_START= /DNA_END= /DNA_ORIENTATION=